MMNNFSNSSLAENLSALYAAMMDSHKQMDWPDIKKRADAAEQLSQLALNDKHSVAWSIVQITLWRLHRRYSYYINDPGDLFVLKILYKSTENPSDLPQLATNMTPQEFSQVLKQTAVCYAGQDTSFGKALQDTVLSEADWTYICYQWLCTALDFPKYIAAASLQLPLPQAYVLYENLYDEAGNGNVEQSHFVELGKIFAKLNIDVNNEAAMLEWCAPGVIAYTNILVRLLIDTDLYTRLGVLFALEYLMPGDSYLLGSAMERSGIKIGQEKYFRLHEEVDIKHADEWLTVIEQVAFTHKQQIAVYQGVKILGQAQKLAWESAYFGWQHWQKTGERQALPFDSF